MTASRYFQNRPIYGGVANRTNEARFLLVACFDPHGIGTIGEYLASWQRFSRFNLHLVNLWPNSGGGPLAIPETVDLRSYDGIILHNTTAYFPANLMNLDSRLRLKFRDYEGVKVLVKQDEHYHSSTYAKFIRANNFDVLVTCVPPSELEKVYPKAIVGDISVVHALTGFVSPYMKTFKERDFANRPIDVSYRGSVQPLSFGRLGFEKRKIGYDVKKALGGRGPRIDISSRWEDRIGGNEWFEFLANSKATLGVESGSNLFDFNGSVERWCQDYLESRGDIAPESEEFYLHADELFLHKYEGNVKYAQISPRHFEAAAARSVQILYEGEYSGIFVKDRHYIALKRDMSNFNEAIEAVQDAVQAKRLVDAAFEEIILNENYSYAHFIKNTDEVLARAIKARQVRQPDRSSLAKAECVSETQSADRAPRALVLMAHEPTLDPRIDWVCKGLANHGFEVVELGISTIAGKHPPVEYIGQGHTRVRIDRKSHVSEAVRNPAHFGEDGVFFPEYQLLLLGLLSKMDPRTLAERLGAFSGKAEDVSHFKWYCEYFYDTNSSLIRAARAIGNFDVVVAADLDVLPSALMVAKESRAISVYDSHEYWKGNFAAIPWAFEFWTNFERKLVELCDICCTVSPPLASQLQLEYETTFLSVPNCESLSAASFDKSNIVRNADSSGAVIFLFQGNFHPERPVSKLIEAWRHTDDNAILWLRGPHWSYRQELIDQAKSTGLLGKRIFFPDAVDETQLVSAAAEAHVGIIPYDPTVHFGYKFACPNKLSQYLAAGLAILTTDLEYVKATVLENKLGRVFNLLDIGSLIEQVNDLARDQESRATYSSAGRRFFLEKFNWESVSKPLYDRIFEELAAHRQSSSVSRPDLRFDWAFNHAGGDPILAPLVHTPLLDLLPSATHSTLRMSWSSLPAFMRNFLRPKLLILLRSPYAILRQVWFSLPSFLRNFLRPKLARIRKIFRI
jgi:glycosyltransferase involved in cell wall biosynthesis